MTILLCVGLVILAYLLGSVPNAVWIGKAFFKVDVREHGSGNAGATNVLRTLGRRAALPVFLLDGLKGYLAVMLSWFLPAVSDVFANFSEPFINFRILLIIAVVVGHIFPIFAQFRGGKGVATIAGAMVAFAPVPIILSLIVFSVMLLWKHYVSLGSIMGAVTFPLFTILSPWVSKELHLREALYINDVISPTMIIFSFVVAIVLVVMHRKNIERLKSGNESKVFLFKHGKM